MNAISTFCSRILLKCKMIHVPIQAIDPYEYNEVLLRDHYDLYRKHQLYKCGFKILFEYLSVKHRSSATSYIGTCTWVIFDIVCVVLGRIKDHDVSPQLLALMLHISKIMTPTS